MLNDDYTPMEFVVLVLQRFFRMDMEDATRVMLHVHQRGVGVCGIFRYEVAETKVAQVIDFARAEPAPAAMHAGKGLSSSSPRPAQCYSSRRRSRPRRGHALRGGQPARLEPGGR